MTFEIHPHAEIFPLMTGRRFDELVSDIARHGIIEPVVLFEGKLLDGRNRVMAAKECGADVPTRDFVGDDALSFVISANLRRRHLRDSQRAMIAARLAQMPIGGGARQREGLLSRSQAGSLLEVRHATLDRAKQVIRQAPASIIKMIEAGQLSISAAAGISHLSLKEQEAMAKLGPSSISAAARIRDPGRKGRNNYAQLYRIVDLICAGLEEGRLDKADIAASQLRKKISEFVARARA